VSEQRVRAEAALAAALARRVPRRRADFEPPPPAVADRSLVPAAVLVLLERGGEWRMVFTKRTTHVDKHKGEVSFAGGMRDPEDADTRHTALREAHEELGLEPARVTVLGELDDLVTVTGFQVTPVVAITGPDPLYQPNPAEVERVLRVPLAHLRDPRQWFDDVRTWRGETRVLRSCRFGDDIIWGATSRILQGFLELVPDDLEL
jgi:8-oxo-dGTP pyrophosphatase MutT (NUDIX family)